MAAIRLYWRPGSAAMAPHAALAEAGAEYELVRIEREEAQSSPEYRELNPLGVVPTLVDGETVVSESAAILLHLADRFPEARLAPPERSQLYRRLVFLTNTLQPALLRWFYPERYGGGDAVREAAEAEANTCYDVLERALAGREWLAGDERSGADLFCFMLVDWGADLDPPAWEGRPALREHYTRTAALPGVRRMLAEQGLEPAAFARA